ncbi:MAG: type II toxin-antitoxin system HigB family toxin [Bacteroidota bacterium]
MRIIARSALRTFWLKHRDAEQPLKAWFAEAKRASWQSQNSVKDQYKSASILKNGRVVFNIAGNKYRLIVRINYELQILYIRFVGTHREYDTINPMEV